MKQQFLSEVVSSSLVEFQQAVEEFSKLLTKRSVLALSGPMGVGKTEFVKILCRARGVNSAQSPTFALHHQYRKDAILIDHLDLFRIESEDEIEATGFWDLFSQESGLILIEWSVQEKDTEIEKEL